MILVPTILCGGAGSRLWPVSRALHPKPFIRLEDDQSLLQNAFKRAANLKDVQEILTVTNKEFLFKIQDEFHAVNARQLKTDYILEPFGRNTAAAIAVSALYLMRQYGDDAMMLVLAADHLIRDEHAFNQAVLKAIHLAQEDKLVTFGISPETPETGFGYIQADLNTPLYAKAWGPDAYAFLVSKFVEKPNYETACAYLEEGGYLWNSGMFCFKAATILNYMALVCPDILNKAKACFDASEITTKKSIHLLNLEPATFKNIPDISIDYAVMEPCAKAHPSSVGVVPCAIGWSDIGSWSSLGELVQSDKDGNRVIGHSITKDTQNCYIESRERFVGALGLDNLIIVDTPDALLVANRDKAQDVKHLYETLKSEDNELHKLHRTVHRPWGTYTTLEEGPNFKIKRIVVKSGERLSLQMHHHRSEHWIVVQGTAKVTNGEKEFLVRVNESTYIPAGHQHRLENPGMVPLILIEVQSGEYLGEDDIVRFEDNYGRVEA